MKGSSLNFKMQSMVKLWQDFHQRPVGKQCSILRKIFSCTSGNQGHILWSSDTSWVHPMQNDSTTTVTEFAIVDKNNLFEFDVRKRNPNLKLDGLPVLYIPRYFEYFVHGLPFGHPSWFLQGPASFSNLADLMIEFWLDSFSWLSVAVVLG